MPRQITHIVVHCTATPEGRHHDIEEVRKWHLARGWRDIGYHALILLDGTVRQGRPEDEIGAHVAGHNAKTIGVCYVGGMSKDMKYAKDTRTPQQKEALLTLLRELKGRYPSAIIVGHHDFDKGKACPSFGAKDEYADLSRIIPGG